jgi:hypothetical protein
MPDSRPAATAMHTPSQKRGHWLTSVAMPDLSLSKTQIRQY